MAYPALSAEGRMETFLRDENTTTLFVSTLASLRKLRGLSQSRLSAVIRGRKLEDDAYKALNGLMLELERLRDACAPIPINFHHAGVINHLLDLIERKKLLIVCDVDHESDVEVSKPNSNTQQ